MASSYRCSSILNVCISVGFDVFVRQPLTRLVVVGRFEFSSMTWWVDELDESSCTQRGIRMAWVPLGGPVRHESCACTVVSMPYGSVLIALAFPIILDAT